MQSRASPRKPPRPLDPARLEELALTYVARFATTAAKLESYLARKLRERGWDESAAPPAVGALVERIVGLGYINDAAWARAKSGSLLRRGYGMRRIDQALRAAGAAHALAEEDRPSRAARRAAALALARKRGFGPFGKAVPDRAQRERQIAAMLRAGHPLDSARELVDAPSAKAAEDWAAGDDQAEIG